MLLLDRMKMHLGLVLVLAGVALNLWAGIALPDAISNLYASAQSPDLWFLMIIMALVLEIGRFMTSDGNAEEMLNAARRWGGRHGGVASVIALPAILGLIPMPAGALLSAPFVDEAGNKIKATPEWKAAVNYWFRHIWEYWWPLYPGVLIGMSLFTIPMWKFILTQCTFTLAALTAGYFFLVRPNAKALSEVPHIDEGTYGRALLIFSPLVIVILSFFLMPQVVRSILPGISETSERNISSIFGLLIGLLVVLADRYRRMKKGEQLSHKIFSSLVEKKAISLQFSIAGVMIFKEMLAHSGLLPVASGELAGSGIPLTLVVMTLPFMAGMVTGITVGFAGTSFPLVVGLMQAQPDLLPPLATLVLAYSVGYMGIILSPVHLCLIVTRDYFKSSIRLIFKALTACVITIIIYSMAMHYILLFFKV